MSIKDIMTEKVRKGQMALKI